MSRHERLSGLLRIVGERGKVEVDELVLELAVSSATVRRDLDHLAGQQLLTRTRGGAVSTTVSGDLPLRYKSARQAMEKSRIAQAVAAFAQPGAVIGINGGTTATEVARALMARGDLARGPMLTVVTNALNIANELAVRQNIRLVVTGGVARTQSSELTGSLATKVLGEISLDLLVLGVDALDPEAGAFAHHEGEANINQLMAARASRVVVAADSSKLGRRAFAAICPISAVDVVVTDADIPASLAARFTASGVTLHAV